MKTFKLLVESGKYCAYNKKAGNSAVIQVIADKKAREALQGRDVKQLVPPGFLSELAARISFNDGVRYVNGVPLGPITVNFVDSTGAASVRQLTQTELAVMTLIKNKLEKNKKQASWSWAVEDLRSDYLIANKLKVRGFSTDDTAECSSNIQGVDNCFYSDYLSCPPPKKGRHISYSQIWFTDSGEYAMTMTGSKGNYEDETLRFVDGIIEIVELSGGHCRVQVNVFGGESWGQETKGCPPMSLKRKWEFVEYADKNTPPYDWIYAQTKAGNVTKQGCLVDAHLSGEMIGVLLKGGKKVPKGILTFSKKHNYGLYEKIVRYQNKYKKEDPS